MNILRVIRRLLANQVQSSSEDTIILDADNYFFHEDDYCQLELIPRENYLTETRTADEIAAQALESEDDYGWTKCYVRNEENYPTSCKDIPVTEMSDFLLQQGFTQFQSVTTGNATQVEQCTNVLAFKKFSIVVCLDFTTKYLANIWVGRFPEPGHLGLYKQFLLNFSRHYPFLLVDWNNSAVVDISIAEDINQYLKVTKE